MVYTPILFLKNVATIFIYNDHVKIYVNYLTNLFSESDDSKFIIQKQELKYI